MYLKTLIKGMAPGTKVIVYNENGNVLCAGVRESLFGTYIATYGHWRVKHFGPCYNKDDGPYISVTVK